MVPVYLSLDIPKAPTCTPFRRLGRSLLTQFDLHPHLLHVFRNNLDTLCASSLLHKPHLVPLSGLELSSKSSGYIKHTNISVYLLVCLQRLL